VSVPDDRKTARTPGSAPARRGGDGPAPAEPDHAADQAEIARLVEGLVPALVAKLGTLNVGELEVRQGGWRVRLTRPAGAGPLHGRRVTDRAGQRTHPGHESLGAPAPTRTSPVPAAAVHSGGSNGSSGPTMTAVGPGPHAQDGDDPPANEAPGATRGPIATSPAVGVFQPGSKAVGGTRVKAGDRLGVVDMLGIPQDVLAPADGIVVGVIVEGGTAVEYGQDLIHIEAAGAAEVR
jgi:acetyl-CoA carboxylase biotin carboxyl carrier protein